MFRLYNISVSIYFAAIRLYAFFNEKAGKWVGGRKNLFEHIRKSIDPGEKLVWFHTASLGEFEQGREIIEKFREKFSEYNILLTFFSPSGFEIRKNWEGADYIFYLPADTPRNAKRFVELVNPEFAVFIKYEFWFNFLNVLHKKKIPVFIVSAIFRKQQHFFRWYGGWFRRRLRKINRIFVQDQDSLDLLKSIGINRATLSGDTRFDRVAAISKNLKSFPLVEEFSGSNRVLLAGSTWPPDEKLIANYLENNLPDLKLIIAPHETGEERLQSIENRFHDFGVVRFSSLGKNPVNQNRVLLIDGIGYLSGLYRYCDVAYIGGGFGKGIHNILEAVTFGKPVIFGPEYRKFGEAVTLIRDGGAFSIKGNRELEHRLNRLFTDKEFYQNAGHICRKFIDSNKGATDIILKEFAEIVNPKVKSPVE